MLFIPKRQIQGVTTTAKRPETEKEAAQTGASN